MLEEWLTCQGKWLYLEPIFSADEIMKQIPREGSAFRSMDATWRNIMAQVRLESSAVCLTSIVTCPRCFLYGDSYASCQ